MGHLMYSTAAGDVAVDRRALAAVPTPAPLGRFHRPVAFAEYADVVDSALQKHGLEVRSEEFAITKDRQSFFGVMEVEALVGDLITSKEWSVLVGLAGSHHQRLPRKLCLGERFCVCSNLCFYGDIAEFSTRQTLNIWDRLPTLIHDAVERIPELVNEAEVRTDRMKNHALKPRHGDAALVEIHRRKGLSSAQLGVAIREWDEPSFPEHKENGRNVHWLLQACTEAQKPRGSGLNMETVRQRSQIAHMFASEIVQLPLAA